MPCDGLFKYIPALISRSMVVLILDGTIVRLSTSSTACNSYEILMWHRQCGTEILFIPSTLWTSSVLSAASNIGIWERITGALWLKTEKDSRWEFVCVWERERESVCVCLPRQYRVKMSQLGCIWCHQTWYFLAIPLTLEGISHSHPKTASLTVYTR